MRLYVLDLGVVAGLDLRARGIVARKVLSVFFGKPDTCKLEEIGVYGLLEANAGLSILLEQGLQSISFPAEPADPSDTTAHPVLMASLARCEEFDESEIFCSPREADLILYDVD